MEKIKYDEEQSLAQQFNLVVKGKNIITPNLIGYRKIPNGIVEITEGTGFSNEKVYGVTVVQNGIHDHDKSKCCHSIEEVEEHIKTL